MVHEIFLLKTGRIGALELTWTPDWIEKKGQRTRSTGQLNAIDNCPPGSDGLSDGQIWWRFPLSASLGQSTLHPSGLSSNPKHLSTSHPIDRRPSSPALHYKLEKKRNGNISWLLWNSLNCIVIVWKKWMISSLIRWWSEYIDCIGLEFNTELIEWLGFRLNIELNWDLISWTIVMNWILKMISTKIWIHMNQFN